LKLNGNVIVKTVMTSIEPHRFSQAKFNSLRIKKNDLQIILFYCPKREFHGQ